MPKERSFDKIMKLQAFVLQHPEFKERIMGKGDASLSLEVMYNRAVAAGVVWMISKREWRIGEVPTPKIASVVKTEKVDEPTHDEPIESVSYVSKDVILLRIMAHKDVIGRAVADWIELAEVAGIEIMEVQQPVSENNGSWQRVSIKARKRYS